MNHWAFIIAAYGLTFFGTASMLAASFFAMRRAEKAAATIEQGK